MSMWYLCRGKNYANEIISLTFHMFSLRSVQISKGFVHLLSYRNYHGDSICVLSLIFQGHPIAGLLAEMIHQVSFKTRNFVFFVFQQKTNATVKPEPWLQELALTRVMPP